VIVQTVAVGAVIGLAYTLSPLLVISLFTVAVMLRAIASTADPVERRWLMAMVAAAVALRFAAIAGLFLATDHELTPFGTFFGDEDYFIKRSIWLRNAALGIPISPADMRYAFDPLIDTGYVWILAALQIVAGPSPYGVHLVGIVVYVGAAVLLYRGVRSVFGVPAALIGLGLLLFLPSLFIWSLSALKDPLFLALVAVVLALAIVVLRPGGSLRRIVAAAAIAAAVLVAESIRSGGLVLLIGGLLGGITLAGAWRRPRLAGLALAAVIATAPIALANADLRDRIVVAMHRAAEAHWWHVNATGNSYLLLDDDFYAKRVAIPSLSIADSVRFIASAIVSYVVVPLPRHVQSPMAWAFVPEQIVWLAIVALSVVGVAAGMARGAAVTSLLLASTIAFVLPVALTSGNVGTLVRHRGVALIALAWLAGLGLVSSAAWLARRSVVGGGVGGLKAGHGAD
jgi:hypothetical protein